MTTAQMLASFRFRMEDPDGEKWDTDSLTEIYNIFTTAQKMAVDALADAERYELLREIEDTTSLDISGGSANLPSDFYLPVFLRNSSNDLIPVFMKKPPITFNSDFTREDQYTGFAWVFGEKIYFQGAESTMGSHTLGYIKELSDIDGSTNPATSQRVQELTLMIAEWKAWGIDKQPERQGAIAEQIKIEFGVNVGAQ